jgi:hypothetical protein
MREKGPLGTPAAAGLFRRDCSSDTLLQWFSHIPPLWGNAIRAGRRLPLSAGSAEDYAGGA